MLVVTSLNTVFLLGKILIMKYRRLFTKLPVEWLQSLYPPSLWSPTHRAALPAVCSFCVESSRMRLVLRKDFEDCLKAEHRDTHRRTTLSKQRSPALTQTPSAPPQVTSPPRPPPTPPTPRPKRDQHEPKYTTSVVQRGCLANSPPKEEARMPPQRRTHTRL